MKLKELIEKYEAAECVVDFVSGKTLLKNIRRDLEQLDEPEAGHADEAPRYLKNILARLRELPLHSREVWLKVIMSEFKQDFSRAKWREGYEQGKLEGMVEREKVKVPQFVADWYERNENDLDYNIWDYIYNWEDQEESEFKNWFNCSKKAFQTLVNMHQFGYEVDEEKRYLVKIKASGQYIMNNPDENAVFFYSSRAYSKLTRKELEEAGFGWVFDCPGIEIEEV